MTTYTLCQIENEYLIIGVLLDKNTRVELSEAVLYKHWIRSNTDLESRIQMFRSGVLTGEMIQTYMVEKSKILFLHHFESD